MASLEDYKKAYREVVKEEERKGFIAHLIAYIAVNITLVLINIAFTPERIWFIFPLIGWGIGLSMHYYFGIHRLEKELVEREKRAEARLTNR